MTLAPIPPLPDADRYLASDVTAAATIDVNFTVYAEDEIAVLVDGVEISTALWALESVDGNLFDDGPIDDARVRFTPAITGLVEIFGDRAPHRTAQWTEGQGVPTRTQNLTYTKIEATLRELRAHCLAAIKLPPGTRHFRLSNDIEDLKGKYLFFRASDGVPIPADMDPDIVGAAVEQLNEIVYNATTALNLLVSNAEAMIDDAEADFDAQIAAVHDEFAVDLAAAQAAATAAEAARDLALQYRNTAATHATTATTQAGIATTKAAETAAAVILVTDLATTVGSSIIDLGDFDGLTGEATIDFGDFQ